MDKHALAGIQVILPNMNRRFSGITSTVAQVLPEQRKGIRIATVGHPLPGEEAHLSWWELVRLCRGTLPGGLPRIFHARRNIEMLAGLVLKRLLGCRLHLVFTSTAQRHHSAWTRFLYRKMDTLLSTSPRAASFLEREADAIIPHGIDSACYHPAADREAAWREAGLPGRHAIGIFGRVRPQKGVGDFIEALCEVLPAHPGWTAVIIGETTPRHRQFEEDMRAKVEAAGLSGQVKWLGKRPFSEIPEWFRRMSLVVCASRNEGFGLTCLEAMASGVPVVATRAGAWEMIIREGVDGWLVPCGDPSALARSLRQAMQDPVQLAEMGSAARQRIEESFTIVREADAINAVYRGIWSNLAKRPNSAS